MWLGHQYLSISHICQCPCHACVTSREVAGYGCGLSYLPKGELEPDPTTPPQAPRLYPSVSGPPKKSRSVTFPAVPISSITSSVRLGAMLSEGLEKTNKERYPPRQGWKHFKKKDDDPFTDSDSPKEEISTIQRSKKSADHSINGSDPDDSEGDKPPKIPP